MSQRLFPLQNPRKLTQTCSIKKMHSLNNSVAVDCLIQIFEYVVSNDVRDIHSLCLTCSLWNEIHSRFTYSQQHLFQQYYENRWGLRAHDNVVDSRQLYVEKHLRHVQWVKNCVNREVSFEGHLTAVNRCELIEFPAAAPALLSFGYDAMFEWNMNGKWTKMFKPSHREQLDSGYLMVNGCVLLDKVYGSSNEPATYACNCSLFGVTESRLASFDYAVLDYSQEENETQSLCEVYIRELNAQKVDYRSLAVFRLVHTSEQSQLVHTVVKQCLFVDLNGEYPFAIVLDAARQLIVYQMNFTGCKSDSIEELFPCSKIETTAATSTMELIHTQDNVCLVACTAVSSELIELFKMEIVSSSSEKIQVTHMGSFHSETSIQEEKLQQIDSVVKNFQIVRLFRTTFRLSKTTRFSVTMSQSLAECLSVSVAALPLSDVVVACNDSTRNRIAEGMYSGQITLWQYDKHEDKWDIQMQFNLHSSAITVLKFIDAEKLVSASMDRSVRVWNLITGECIVALEDVHMNRITDITFTDRMLISASRDTTLQLVDFSPPDLEKVLFDKSQLNKPTIPVHELKVIEHGKVPIVLVLTGAFSPIHRMHTGMLHVATQYMTCQFGDKYQVVGCYISPAHDSYNKQDLLACYHRINMCELAVAEDEVKQMSCVPMIATWEATQRIFKLQDEVLHAIEQAVNKHYSCSVRVMYVCGSDLLQRMTMHKLLKPHGVICIERPGYNITDDCSDSRVQELKKQSLNTDLFIVPHGYETSIMKEDDVSSTQIRSLLRENRAEELMELTYSSVVSYLKQKKLFN